MHARVHPNAQETEFRAAQSGACAAEPRNRSNHLYTGGRPQFAGALDCADPRGPREGPARRALPRNPRRAGYGGRGQPQTGEIEVRGQEAEVLRAPEMNSPQRHRVTEKFKKSKPEGAEGAEGAEKN